MKTFYRFVMSKVYEYILNKLHFGDRAGPLDFCRLAVFGESLEHLYGNRENNSGVLFCRNLCERLKISEKVNTIFKYNVILTFWKFLWQFWMYITSLVVFIMLNKLPQLKSRAGARNDISSFFQAFWGVHFSFGGNNLQKIYIWNSQTRHSLKYAIQV